MNVRSLLAIATLSIATTAFAADGNFERTLTTGSTPNVSVATGSGYIRLKPGSDNQVHIVGHVHANHGWGPVMPNPASSRSSTIRPSPRTATRSLSATAMAITTSFVISPSTTTSPCPAPPISTPPPAPAT